MTHTHTHRLVAEERGTGPALQLAVVRRRAFPSLRLGLALFVGTDNRFIRPFVEAGRQPPLALSRSG